MSPIFSSARRPLTALLVVAIVSGVPGLDFYQAFADKGKQTRTRTPNSGERSLGLPVEGAIREVVGEEIPRVDEADAGIDGRGELKGDETRSDAVLHADRSAVLSPITASRAQAAPPVPERRDASAVKDAPGGLPRSANSGSAITGDRAADRDDYFWPEALGETRRDVREELGIVPASTVGGLADGIERPRLAPPTKIPYAVGSVDEPAFIKRQRDDNERYSGVVVLDINYTIEDAGTLRSGVEQYLARLREANLKVVLWTGADREWTDRFLRSYPGLAAHVNLILTRENYCAGCADHDPRLAFKDLSVLGYDWIVDDHPRLAPFAEAKGFVHFKIDAFDKDDPSHAGFEQAIGDVLELARLRRLKRGPDRELVKFYDVRTQRDQIRAALGTKPVFVINRAPIKLDVSDKDKRAAEIVRSNGGAAPAIKGTLDKAGGGLVIAAANTRTEQALARQKRIMRVGDIWMLYLDIPKDVMDRYYNGFANRWLWPVFHGENVTAEFFVNQGGRIEEMREDFELGYRKANQQFADAIVDLIGKDYSGSLSIEDYHLYLLAARLREKGFHGVLEHFTHIPFPSWRFLNQLSAENKRLLAQAVEGLLANDIIGFHTHEYVENFMTAAKELLGAAVIVRPWGVTISHHGRVTAVKIVAGDEEQVPWSQRLLFQSRKTDVRSFPISVDVDSILREMESPEAQEHFRRLERLAAGRTLITDVARIDPTKGLPQSLKAYYRLIKEHYGPDAKPRPPSLGGFLRHPIFSLRRLIVGEPRPPLFYGLFQPSREGIEEYRELQATLLRLARLINGEFSKGKWHGIISNQAEYEEFLNLPPDQVPFVVLQMTGASHPKVVATLAASEVGNIAPFADGMNLVAKEYVVAAANAWRLTPGWIRYWGYLKRSAAKWALGIGSVLILTRTIGAHAELAPHVLTIKDPSAIGERTQVMKQAIDAAYGQAKAPKAESAFRLIRRNDLNRWGEARRAAIQARAPPAQAGAASETSGPRDLRSGVQWTLLVLGAVGALAGVPLLGAHFEGVATVMGVAGSLTFMAMPAVLFATTLRNLWLSRSAESRSKSAGEELEGLGKRWLPLLSNIGGNLLNLPAFLTIAFNGAGLASLLPALNAGAGVALHVAILSTLALFGYFSKIKTAAILAGIAASFATLPFILPHQALLDGLAVASIPVGFLFTGLQIYYNAAALRTLRKHTDADARRPLTAEMAAITPKYLLIGLFGNLIFLPVLMVAGRWYMLLGSSVGMVGTLIILYQLYRAGLFRPGDLLRLSAGSAAWAALILVLSRSIPTDFWK